MVWAVLECFMPSTPVAGLLHIGLAFHFSCSDAADHDVDMDVSRMVVPIGVSADDGRMTGEVVLRRTAGQGPVPVPWSSRCRLHRVGSKLMI